jgi:inorganic triphosphatase YgiF
MATTQHLEIEAKYDLPEGAAVPDLVGVGSVARVDELPAQVLTATYYDTADLALQQHRITLRRRTGGSDDGWHLKLPVAGGERLEVRRSLGSRPAVPLPLRRLLVAVVADDPDDPRDQRLVPVATLVTHRAVRHLVGPDGAVLAELADDLVTVERDGAEVLRWRELEVELVDGDPDLLARLDAAVRAAGLQPAAASSKIGRVLSAGSSGRSVSWTPRLRAATAAEPLLAESATRLRVLDAMARAGRAGAPSELEQAVRRRRSAVDVARRLGAVAADVAAEQRRELAWAEGSLAGAARLDAAAALVRESLDEQPAELVLGPVARRLDREVAARRRAEQHHVAELLDSPRWLRLVAAGRVVGPDRGPRLGKALPDLTARTSRRLERRLRDLADASDRTLDERLAAARRAAGAALLVHDLADRSGVRLPGPAGHVAASSEALDRLAAVLGAIDLARATGVAAHLAGENGFTFGRLHGLLDAQAAAVVRQLRAERKALRRARRKA